MIVLKQISTRIVMASVTKPSHAIKKVASYTTNLPHSVQWEIASLRSQ